MKIRFKKNTFGPYWEDNEGDPKFGVFFLSGKIIIHINSRITWGPIKSSLWPIHPPHGKKFQERLHKNSRKFFEFLEKVVKNLEVVKDSRIILRRSLIFFERFPNEKTYNESRF